MNKPINLTNILTLTILITMFCGCNNEAEETKAEAGIINLVPSDEPINHSN